MPKRPSEGKGNQKNEMTIDVNNYESNMELIDSSTPPVTPAPVVEEPKVEPSPEVPAVEPTVEAPANPTPETTPPVEEPKLYDLPDGRKVDAETLAKEFRENFLPEFTRKSQALAEIERKKGITSPEDEGPAWKKPDYVPQNYGEVIELAKAEAIKELEGRSEAERMRVESVQREVDSQLAELKKIDPKLDENALFVHANKYGFRDLKAAHSNMSDMKKALVDVEQRTLKNLKTREADPISTGAGGEAPDTSGYDPNLIHQFEGAAEYLAYIKGKK